MQSQGMTKIELVVVLFILAALIGILIPAIGSARRTARSMQRSTPIRGVHMSMVMYAQDNDSWFPGLLAGEVDRNREGVDYLPTVESRFELLLNANYFTGEYAISPSETRMVWTTGIVTSAHYSYAMLQLPVAGARRREWRETLNSEAPVMTDRNAGTSADVFSVHTDPGEGWSGSVAYNDNHVVFEQTHRLPTVMDGIATKADDLFTAMGDDDALLIHSGDGR